MEVCEVEDEGLVLWRALNVALIIGLCTAPPAPVRRQHRHNFLLWLFACVVIARRWFGDRRPKSPKFAERVTKNIRENRDYFNPDGRKFGYL
jgi:hypothetical protein